MHLRACDLQDHHICPLTPLFGTLAVGFSSYMFALVGLEEMLLWIVVVFVVLYLLEMTTFIQRFYKGWQSVLLMVSCGQIGMCLGAFLEFGSSGLLTKYALCANLPGFGFETTFQVLAISPLTHLGMFLGCFIAALLQDPDLLQKQKKLSSVLFQSALFLFLAVLASSAMSLVRIENIWNSYFLHLGAMHLTMALCMIGTSMLQIRFARIITTRITNNV